MGWARIKVGLRVLSVSGGLYRGIKVGPEGVLPFLGKRAHG